MDESPAATDQRPSPALSRRLAALVVAVAAVVLALDQLTKTWAVARLSDGDTVDLVGELLQLRLTRNSGAAFSFATGSTWVFTIIATVVAVVILRISRRLGSLPWAITLGMLLGGALGNLMDRLFRAPGFARGHVVDFLELPNWPVFNLADSFIVSAAVLIGLLGLRGIGVDGTRTPA